MALQALSVARIAVVAVAAKKLPRTAQLLLLNSEKTETKSGPLRGRFFIE